MTGKSKILVTGGAGYIGSHTILDLIENGFEVISIDNFSNSTDANFDGIEKLTGIKVKNYNVDLCDEKATERVFEENRDIKGIIHFAAYKYVGESYREPLKYFKNNIDSLLSILSAQQKYQVPSFLFSSSCTVYGNAEKLPVTESTPMQEAESVYGRTKQMSEQILKDLNQNNGTGNLLSLRYFNPAGIHESRFLTETTEKPQETLVPIIQEVYDGKRDKLTVFGGNYNTRDGSCVRDYIHVVDLAKAHTAGVNYLLQKEGKNAYEIINLGSGNGTTVLEMVKAAEEVKAEPLNYEVGSRRPGDVEATYADCRKAEQLLGWKPVYGLKEIFESVLS